MRRYKLHWLSIVILLFSFSLASTAEGETWMTYARAGDKAYRQGNYVKAEKEFLAAIKKAEEFGPQDPRLSKTLNNLAHVYRLQGKNAEAEPLLKRALSIREKVLGPEHARVATTLSNLASLYQAQGKHAEAEPIFKRVLTIRVKVLGPKHPKVALSLDNLALFYHAQGKYTKAEPLCKRTLAILEKTLGQNQPYVAVILENYAKRLRRTKRKKDAKKIKTCAKAIP